jgi:hypothetical protein
VGARKLNPYRQNVRRLYSVLPTINGHVMATCRDARGWISYTCIMCGRETPMVTIGRDSVRYPDTIPLDACPFATPGAPWDERDNGYYELGDPERRTMRTKGDYERRYPPMITIVFN